MNKLANNLKIGFGISLFLLIVSSVASYYTINRLIDSSGWVDHTHEVLRVSEEVLSIVKDGETGQRGYLLTEQQDFLEPYNGALNNSLASLAELKHLTKDNLPQQSNCDTLELLVHKRFAVLQQGIEDKRAGNNPNLFLLRDGSNYMQQIRLLIKKIQHVEEKLLQERTVIMNRFVSYAPIAILLATVLALGITIFFFRRVINDSRQKSEMALSLDQKDKETTARIGIIQTLAGKIAKGDYSIRLNEAENDELGSLAGSLNRMGVSLDQSFSQLREKEWLQSGTASISEKIAGEKSVNQLAQEAITLIADYTNSLVGVLYVMDYDETLFVAGAHALPESLVNRRFKKGEGLPGQCVKARVELLIKNIDNEIFTNAGSGDIKPKQLLFFPIKFENSCTGVIELGSINGFTNLHVDYLKNISEILGVSINTAANRVKLKELLEETQAQTEELQAQHRELENMNTELEVQAEKLQTSEEELRVQQEELVVTNEELEERSRLLEEKNHMVVLRNLEIQKKAEELEESTRYKSEFLANMSHELRTPLNSVLLLSRLLSENNSGNLNPDQVEYAQVIQSSGNGLLQLIDEILDLSKIESGKVELEYDQVKIADILENMRLLFGAMAKEKKIEFNLIVREGVPSVIETDMLRVEQILKNLISNALKFTPSGSIVLEVVNAAKDDNKISFIVKDTGIGVASNKQQMIFEAFQQADGSTKRKYGGTGLGLSISRQLSRLLGGDITLVSNTDKGSTFTLTIPIVQTKKTVKEVETINVESTVSSSPSTALPEQKSPLLSSNIPLSLPDDRGSIVPADKVLLVVEDDVNFAKALMDFARQKKYKVIHTVRGDEVASLVKKYNPMGLLMDIQLPVKDGLTVMDELKKDPLTRHIPIHIMSSFEVKKESISRGAVDFLNKPVAYEQMNKVLEKIEQAMNTDLKKVLIVEDNSYHARALAYFLASHQVSAFISDDVQDSIKTLQKKEVNCVILDVGAQGTTGYETLDIVKQHADLENVPIIIFTGKSLSRNEEQRIRQYADAIVVKTAHSYQRILNEVSLFLHLMDKPDDKKSVKNLGTLDAVLKGKTVLVADDDIRNIFALSKALEKHSMKVITAMDGKEAMEQLENDEVIDILLIDMMMPEMDGYETITRIRERPKWKRLPVIAVTAKAMKGDREKCIQVGASDYISKPIDTDQLLSLMRVWLYDNGK